MDHGRGTIAIAITIILSRVYFDLFILPGGKGAVIVDRLVHVNYVLIPTYSTHFEDFF